MVCVPQALIRVDIGTGDIEEWIGLPFILDKGSEEYAVVHAYDNGVLVVPNVDSVLYVYYPERREWEEIKFEKIGNGRQLFSCSYRNGDSIYLFPGSSDNVVVFNTISKDVTIRIKLLSELNACMNTDIKVLNPVCVVDSKVIGVTSLNNIVFIYDLQNENIETKKIGKEGSQYSSCISFSDEVILYDKTNCSLLLLDKNMEVIKEMKIPTGGYRVLKYSDDYLIVDSLYGNTIFIIDKYVEECIEAKKSEEALNGNSNVLGVMLYDEKKTYYYNKIDNSLYSINEGRLIKIMEIPHLNDDIKKNILNTRSRKLRVENYAYNLSDFVSLLSID